MHPLFQKPEDFCHAPRPPEDRRIGFTDWAGCDKLTVRLWDEGLKPLAADDRESSDSKRGTRESRGRTKFKIENRRPDMDQSLREGIEPNLPARPATESCRQHLAKLLTCRVLTMSIRNGTGGKRGNGGSSEGFSSGAGLFKLGGYRARLLAAGSLVLLGLAMAAPGQEAVRMSVAGDAAAAAQRRAASTIGYYNLKLGPTAWNFGAGLGVDYNSNVNNTEDNPEGDFIFRPQITTRMLWPVTDRNSINLALGAGYSAYVNNQQLDRLYLTPGSGLSFDLYAGDFWINLHDRFSITENSYQDPTLTGTGNYSQLQNALGTTVVWDLNKAVLKFGYDHVNYVSLPSTSGQPDGMSEVASLSAGYAPKPGMLAGLEVGGDLTDYTGGNVAYSSARQWNVGGFYDTQVSEYIHFTGHAGYTVYYPEPGPGVTVYATDFNGMYAELDLTHRLNEYVTYTLSGGRTINLAFYGGTVDEYYARLSAAWQFLRKMNLGTTLSYEYGTQLSGTPETWDRYGFAINLGRSITSKLSGSLGYQFYLRQSDLPGRSYDLNVLSLSFNYVF
jgi:hypothetical protein